MPTVTTPALTVSEYSSRLSRALRAVGPGTVEGEVQKPRRSGGGMLWFSLTDGEATLSCKVFRGQAQTLEHTPREGDLVRVEVERPDLWPRQGKLDLIVSQIRLAGEGELLRARERLLARLRAEGLCDPARRRPLPRFPRAVGVIAGRDSDGLSDVIRALVDRWPAVHVVTSPCVVQGKSAPWALIDALARLGEHPSVDVIVMARGGGSVQDLACFDDERLCRAVFACAVPVVAAIGHTNNDPVCNHVAWPAFTPSRSAELAVPSAAELRGELRAAGERLERVPLRMQRAGERLYTAAGRLDGAAALETHTARVRESAAASRERVDGLLADRRHGVERAHGILGTTPHRAARELAARREGVPGLAAALGATDDRLERLARAVDDQAARVRVGTRRQLEDHTRDYGRATARLSREAAAGLERCAGRARGLVEDAGAGLAERARRRLDGARREAVHGAALVAARDPRRRGWLLARTAEGVPVRSATQLAPGQRVALHLHDGRAETVVESVDPESGRRTA